jgi:hypothetical protein
MNVDEALQSVVKVGDGRGFSIQTFRGSVRLALNKITALQCACRVPRIIQRLLRILLARLPIRDNAFRVGPELFLHIRPKTVFWVLR